MKIQKIYIEAYVNDGVQLNDELDEQLLDDERCSWRNVVMISDEETNDTFPENKEECIAEQLSRIEGILENQDMNAMFEIGNILREVAEGLRSVLQ